MAMTFDNPVPPGPVSQNFTADGTYDKINPMSNPTVTGTAVYTDAGGTHTVNGTNGRFTGRKTWAIDFSIPVGGVTCNLTVTINENGTITSATDNGIQVT